MELNESTIVMQMENDEIDHIKTEPIYYMVNDGDDDGNRDMIFLQVVDPIDDEPDLFVEGEEVDLNKIDEPITIEHLIATPINDVDEPYKDSNGGLYYICGKCKFVCSDRVTLMRHTAENHTKMHRYNKNSDDTLQYSVQNVHKNDTESISEPINVKDTDNEQLNEIDRLKPYQCEICFKRLSTKTNLRGHITTHSDEKPFLCPICSKNFKQKRHLKYHMKIHVKYPELSYINNNFELMDESQMKYSNDMNTNSSKPNLNQLDAKEREIDHPSFKQPEKLFPCDECNASYTSKSNLNRHKQTHMKDAPFKCKYCTHGFQSKHYLMEHIKKRHNERMLYRCITCWKMFQRRAQLEQHRKHCS